MAWVVDKAAALCDAGLAADAGCPRTAWQAIDSAAAPDQTAGTNAVHPRPPQEPPMPAVLIAVSPTPRALWAVTAGSPTPFGTAWLLMQSLAVTALAVRRGIGWRISRPLPHNSAARESAASNVAR
jgi:hypothetical protein